MCDGWKWKEWCEKMRDSRRAELGKKQGICARLLCLTKEDGDVRTKGWGVPQEAGKEELIGAGFHGV